VYAVSVNMLVWKPQGPPGAAVVFELIHRHLRLNKVLACGVPFARFPVAAQS